MWLALCFLLDRTDLVVLVHFIDHGTKVQRGEEVSSCNGVEKMSLLSITG